jgi:hypothetical protein
MPLPMTTSEQLLRRYEEGRLTAQGLILAVLGITGKKRLAKIVEALPGDLLELLKDFVDHYRPGMRVFHGPLPKISAVRIVREWFDDAGARKKTTRAFEPSGLSELPS